MRLGTFFQTGAGADVTITTKGGAFLGAIVYGSAAGETITITESSSGNIIALINASSLDSKAFTTAVPIAYNNGITCTASGTGGYTIFFATSV